MDKNKLFGTDGIRGEFGQWPLVAPVFDAVSCAAGKWLKKKHRRKQYGIIIGKDTRFSCDKIEQALAQGFAGNGITVYSAGVIPTPGLAYLAQVMDVQLGVMISASHNPAHDNGIKFFKQNGFKFSEKEEREVERIAFNLLESGAKPQRAPRKKIKLINVSAEPYLEHLKQCVNNVDLNGLKISVDCSHGAVSSYAEELFSSLGAKVYVLNNKPDGYNINCRCGSLYPERVSKAVRQRHSDAGCSFDGDADRVIFCDEQGNIRDGDYLMALVARHFLTKKCLAANAVVGTSMSNFGLEQFLRGLGVALVRADVGDKYVLQEIIRHKANFGGEQSGHIIFLDYATTGDGLLTALQVLRILKESGKKASRLFPRLKKYPQLIHNIRVKEKRDFKKMPRVWEKIQSAEKALENQGRLVMRYSGTERLARIMVEGKNNKQIHAIAESIGAEIRKEIGC
ncbi:MAG: phosphoglucosamine mutase [Candidatus Omnitrophica bacterium]|nr:phosphoglucosamine mutase [Candidatus Omnitrophota bacterium]